MAFRLRLSLGSALLESRLDFINEKESLKLVLYDARCVVAVMSCIDFIN